MGACTASAHPGPCGFSRYTLHTSGFSPKHPPSSLLSLSVFPWSAIDSRMRDGQVQDLVLLATAAVVRGIDARDVAVLQKGVVDVDERKSTVHSSVSSSAMRLRPYVSFGGKLIAASSRSVAL